MTRLAQLPADLVFFTQITMEAAEDPAFLDAMRTARIRGALVGIEAVTPEGLRDIHKDFNVAGEALVSRLRRFREHGVPVLGSFIFGLPSDRPETFDHTAALATRSRIDFAQFVMLTPLPGTLDFDRWEREAIDQSTIGGVPLTRYWLIPPKDRPKVYTAHAVMSPDEIRRRTQRVWDRFYDLKTVWQRSTIVSGLRRRLTFVLMSKLYRQMYASTGLAPTARGSRARPTGPAGSPDRYGVCSRPTRCRISWSPAGYPTAAGLLAVARVVPVAQAFRPARARLKPCPTHGPVGNGAVSCKRGARPRP